MPDRILIWGAGAIGGTAGAHLARAGHDVTFVDIAADHVAAIRDPARGLHISGAIADFRLTGPAFLPEELSGTWDHIYLCVKSQFTQQASNSLAPHLTDNGYVVSLQNGLCEEIVAKVVGADRVVGAFINFGADWLGPGEIIYGNRGAFVLGECDGRITDRLMALQTTICDFEPDAIITDDINSYLWAKLGYASFLYAHSLGQLGIADCLERPELLPLFRQLGLEVNAVAERLDISPRGFNGYDPAAFLPGVNEADVRRSIEKMVAFNRANTKTHSGVWRDLAVRKRRTEVDVHILPVVTAGETLGIACPMLARLVAMIHEIEDGKRAMADDNLLELLNA